jgi:hypothetical protein
MGGAPAPAGFLSSDADVATDPDTLRESNGEEAYRRRHAVSVLRVWSSAFVRIVRIERIDLWNNFANREGF